MTVMVVSILGFGSVWRLRFSKDRGDALRYTRGAYYNTTGVPVAGVIRTRPKIVGHVRLNAAAGFNPNAPWRALHRVFECDEPSVWQGQNKVFVRHLLAQPRVPDYFLVVVRQREVGRLQVGASGWKADGVMLISLSESGDEQEGMLLLPAYAWVRSSIGTLVLQPVPLRPWIAHLQLAPTPPLAD